MPRHAGSRVRTSRRARLTALAGVAAACAVVLPLAVASAGQDSRRQAAAGSDVLRETSVRRTSAGPDAPRRDAVGPDVPGPSPVPGAPGSAAPAAPPADATARASTADPVPPGGHLSAALRCGPALSAPEGVEAQTCVVMRGEDVWARTYHRNLTGRTLEAALALLGPDGRSVRSRCAVSAGDDPSLCETPRVRIVGEPPAYTAVAEFARHAASADGAGDGGGRLLLRSGSNSPAGDGR
ncbi:hypothetical protein HTV80_05125 [Streptomyces sp. Vc74B-19]|uniref:hypothetical protein n=1 Tax=Streptomyces sp. CNZ748 TaxID=2885160 RepID=UPI001BFCB13E|nr:hypothetical protein [Streptomyces sp. CNZ748]MBT3162492.1 hypothetical protein [Streptomyces sp. Vc74B-19]